MAPNNENHYDTHTYAGDQAAQTRRVMNHMPDEDRSSTQDIQQSINSRQATELAPDVRMGDDRVIGDTPNWDSYTSEQLYNFATQSNSPTTADDLGRAFNEGGNSLAEAANALFEAVTALDSAWTGVAAESAKGALKPLAQAAGGAGQTAQLMGVRMSQQSVAATEVRKLPPAKSFDQSQSLNAMLVGGPAAMTADLKAQKEAADGVKREQISYLNAYTTSMSAVDAATPSFVPPPETTTGGGRDSGSFTGSSVNIQGTGSSTPVLHNTTTGAPTSKFTGVGNGSAGSPGFVNDNGETDQSGYTPLPGPGTATAGYQPTPSPSVPSGPSTFGPGGPPGGTSVPGAGSGGFGPGFGSFGSPGAAAGGGASGGANPGAGAGPKGMTPTGMAPTGSAAGRGGPGGMGGAPRGRGDGEEDQEHERPSYLVEGDPESAFGSDQMTAPPVIGGTD
jgi:hypothetical protein